MATVPLGPLGKAELRRGTSTLALTQNVPEGMLFLGQGP